MKLTAKRLSIPVVGAILLGLLSTGAAIAAFTASRSASTNVDADSVKTGATPSVSTSGDTATVTFSAITLDSNRPVLGYELRRNGGSIITCSTSPCQDTGLAPGNYSYDVRGVYQNWRGAFSPASTSKTIAQPDLTFTSGAAATCSSGAVTLPAGTTSWTSKVSRSYATSAGATSVTVAKTAGANNINISGSPLTINANTTESTGSISVGPLTNGATATVTATATNATQAACNISVANPAPTGTTVTLTATADTYRDNSTTNRGGATTLIVNPNVPSNGPSRALLRFDLSGIPAGATIESATLTLARTNQTPARQYGLQRTTGSWNEAATPDALVFTGTGTVSTLDATEGAATLAWDVKSLVTATIADSTTAGWILNDTGNGNSTTTFGSRDNATAGNRPSLSITYTTP